MMQNLSKLQIVEDDPYLQPFKDYFYRIHDLANKRLDQFKHQGGLEAVSKSYIEYGLHKKGNLYLYKEWAPAALGISVFGEFNGWNREQYKCEKDDYGHWTCSIDLQIKPLSKVKCQVLLPDKSIADRIPAWINATVQNEDKSFDGLYAPLGDYAFKHPKPTWSNDNLRIYQCHIGMSGVEERVHTFREFQTEVLPRVVSLGYNTLQIMGILQHPYYGSFGYHVSNFFSVSSRFGTPNDLKALIDQAHKQGLKVIIDLVHSHAAKNVSEGINMWDGTDYQYFHSGGKGNHPLWDSRIFDYSKYQVLRFLLSNVRFWLEEYNTDGYRYDGVTSMLYTHHGASYGFTGNYHEYFNDNLDLDSLSYLELANKLAKSINPQVILIAEDVSGLPGLCRSVEDGGIGFNFRLAMALPDMWIKHLKEFKDEDWDIEKIAYELTNRRWKEKTIAYAQSHDQALVGDKTLSMWLFNQQIYTNMSTLNDETLRIFRGIALHKMMRLLTFSLGGEGYLNFMGNEFGHPQWVDFPRQGNQWSYKYCTRRWYLVDDHTLRYQFLNNFDRRMMHLDIERSILGTHYQFVRTKHNQDKVLIYEKGDTLFIFNFHCTCSFEQYQIYVKACKGISVLFSTDDKEFGGHCRVQHCQYKTERVDDFCSKFLLYLPNRCAIVASIEVEKK